MAKPKKDVAQLLLDAHVQFIAEQIEGKALKALIETELDNLLEDAGKLTLKSVVSAAAVKQTVRVFAVELEVGSGIPELVGDVARAVHAHESHGRTRFGDLISDRLFGEFLDQLLEQKTLREKLVHEVTANPIYSAFVSDLLYEGIKGYLSQNAVTRNIPGAGAMMKLGKSMMSKATPSLEASIEESLKKYIGRSVQATARKSAELFLEHADEAALRDAALDAWARLKTLKVSSLRDEIDGRAVEEAFVSIYELWHELRGGEYYSALIHAGIDAVFDKYGNATLRELLEDFGIVRELMLAEAMRYAPPVIKVLKKKKMLDPMIRRLLEPFYRSGAVEKVLAAA